MYVKASGFMNVAAVPFPFWHPVRGSARRQSHSMFQTIRFMVFVRKLFAKVRIISGFFLFLHLNLNINECNVAVKNKDIIANFDKDYYDWIYRIKL